MNIILHFVPKNAPKCPILGYFGQFGMAQAHSHTRYVTQKNIFFGLHTRMYCFYQFWAVWLLTAELFEKYEPSRNFEVKKSNISRLHRISLYFCDTPMYVIGCKMRTVKDREVIDPILDRGDIVESNEPTFWKKCFLHIFYLKVYKGSSDFMTR